MKTYLYKLNKRFFIFHKWYIYYILFASFVPILIGISNYFNGYSFEDTFVFIGSGGFFLGICYILTIKRTRDKLNKPILEISDTGVTFYDYWFYKVDARQKIHINFEDIKSTKTYVDHYGKRMFIQLSDEINVTALFNNIKTNKFISPLLKKYIDYIVKLDVDAYGTPIIISWQYVQEDLDIIKTEIDKHLEN